MSDLKRLSKASSNTELLSRILEWQHLAPTVPDTVDGFPFADRDPFVVDAFPHVLFAANQSEADYSIAEFENGARTLLLSVPSFAKTNSVVIVNLRTLEAHEHVFFANNSIF